MLIRRSSYRGSYEEPRKNEAMTHAQAAHMITQIVEYGRTTGQDVRDRCEEVREKFFNQNKKSECKRKV